MSEDKIQILIEVPRNKVRTEDGGTVLVLVDKDVIASEPVPVGDRLVRAHVACRVYAKVAAAEVAALRRRARVRRNSPVLFTSL